jgi:GNAT superfamily N-acetyltransferase
MIPSSEIGALGILWMLRLDRPLPNRPEARIPAGFSRADPEVVGELASAMDFDNPAVVLQRFSMGRDCYIARVVGKIASYGWITYDVEGIGELGLSIRLGEGEAYIWDCGTLPGYRGQRIYPALLGYMLGELQNAGLQRVWIGTDADNLPSQVGVALVGCQPVLDVVRDISTSRLVSRGRPGVPLEDVVDAHYTMFGNRDVTQIILPENSE